MRQLVDGKPAGRNLNRRGVGGRTPLCSLVQCRGRPDSPRYQADTNTRQGSRSVVPFFRFPPFRPAFSMVDPPEGVLGYDPRSSTFSFSSLQFVLLSRWTEELEQRQPFADLCLTTLMVCRASHCPPRDLHRQGALVCHQLHSRMEELNLRLPEFMSGTFVPHAQPTQSLA